MVLTVYFVSVESLDSCHSTSRGVNCVCILFQLNLLILVTVLHVVLTLNQCVEEDKVRNIRYLFTPIDFYSLVCYLVVLGGLYREAG